MHQITSHKLNINGLQNTKFLYLKLLTLMFFNGIKAATRCGKKSVRVATPTLSNQTPPYISSPQ